MKKMLFVCAALAAGLALAAENPYSSYGKATERVKGDPAAVEWQDANAAAIAAATAPDVLAAFVADAASAKALLDQIQPAYAAPPLTLTQIAAVTQWVMGPEPCWLFFWEPSPANGRKIWTAALQEKIATAKDDYVRAFCRQQLDLCQ